MTSSLVGSEMCIRDSRKTGWSRCGYTCRNSANEETGTTKTWKPQSRMAVSYTHLTLPTICSV
eukprot:5716517-Prorocentrum_lima.AAC.1